MKKFFLKTESGTRLHECSEAELEQAITGAMACNGPAAKYRRAVANCWSATQKGEFTWHCSENSNSNEISRPSTREEIMAELEAGKEIPTSPWMGPSCLCLMEPPVVVPPKAAPEMTERTECWECGGAIRRGKCMVCGEEANP